MKMKPLSEKMGTGSRENTLSTGSYEGVRAPVPIFSDDARFLQALEEYARLCRGGGKPNRAEFLARYPDVAANIEECLDGIEFVEQIAPQLRDASADAAPDGSSSNSAFRTPGYPLGGGLETLGDFQILRELGRGGMGVVYEAVQVSLDRRVALKVLPFAAMLSETQLTRFKNEARAAATLKHPNIVSIFSVGVERGVHYYAMELIDGPSLAEVIERMRNAECGVRNEEDGVRIGGSQRRGTCARTPPLGLCDRRIEDRLIFLSDSSAAAAKSRRLERPEEGNDRKMKDREMAKRRAAGEPRGRRGSSALGADERRVRCVLWDLPEAAVESGRFFSPF